MVALTGGIASGKTAVSNRFADLGICVVDTDILARDVVEVGSEGLRGVISLFGETVLREDGTLDRAALRDRVFADPAQRRSLERLLHPLIRDRGQQQVSEADSAYVLYVIPLLLESGSKGQFDRVLVVDIPAELQLQRLMKRSDLSVDQATAMINAQAERDARLAIADDIIINDGSLLQLADKVDLLHQRYLQLAAKKAEIPLIP
ncbi:MAG: dephospho-CoA kinase [Lysobacteraceae bacterium]|nr:MAG: dephospho-CoA kinase [Xanthomonadaceae bacterium]